MSKIIEVLKMTKHRYSSWHTCLKAIVHGLSGLGIFAFFLHLAWWAPLLSPVFAFSIELTQHFIDSEHEWVPDGLYDMSEWVVGSLLGYIFFVVM